MPIESINPATGALLERFDPMDDTAVTARLDAAERAAADWSCRTMAARVGISRTAVNRIWRAHGIDQRQQFVVTPRRPQAIEAGRRAPQSNRSAPASSP
jgi:hypothetical protein